MIEVLEADYLRRVHSYAQSRAPRKTFEQHSVNLTHTFLAPSFFMCVRTEFKGFSMAHGRMRCGVLCTPKRERPRGERGSRITK